MKANTLYRLYLFVFGYILPPIADNIVLQFSMIQKNIFAALLTSNNIKKKIHSAIAITT